MAMPDTVSEIEALCAEVIGVPGTATENEVPGPGSVAATTLACGGTAPVDLDTTIETGSIVEVGMDVLEFGFSLVGPGCRVETSVGAGGKAIAALDDGGSVSTDNGLSTRPPGGVSIVDAGALLDTSLPMADGGDENTATGKWAASGAG
jgi:hypothetical protein